MCDTVKAFPCLKETSTKSKTLPFYSEVISLKEGGVQTPRSSKSSPSSSLSFPGSADGLKKNPCPTGLFPKKPCESCELTADPRVKRTTVENPKNYGGRCRAPEEVIFKGLTSLEADESSSRSPWEERKKKKRVSCCHH